MLCEEQSCDLGLGGLQSCGTVAAHVKRHCVVLRCDTLAWQCRRGFHFASSCISKSVMDPVV